VTAFDRERLAETIDRFIPIVRRILHVRAELRLKRASLRRSC